eukprot:CAMPEP_0197642456 /NCGR_PEP_ID=MMETSP1338-20131121/16107_1 /TAXON_ID=43686 ORGANISM="Pelagodinium beii, Strain RCC1491" /NCGR_SAMPLE_ID=MMETSP1338 /ASSEMBLY_ACC=CAM_ASM_000754 /LENGTH=498 /DNA_ID=CAMNT_0043215575 /DNA_START=158 /DNA_END=1654 /DNA_ORIENTATION=+
MRIAIRNSTATRCFDLFKHHLRKAWNNIFKLLKDQASSSEVDRHIQERLKSERLAGAKASYLAAANFMCFVVMAILWNLSWEIPRWMTVGQDVACIVALALLELARVGPGPTELLMEIYFGLMTILLATFLLCSSPAGLSYSFFASLIMRYSVSALHSKRRSVLFWNIAATCSSCIFLQQSAQHSSMMMIFDAFLTALGLLSVSAMQQKTVARIQQELKVGNLKMENSASLSLLEMSCDVVLRLHMDLTLEHDSRQFAALLMRSSGVPMNGLRFADFMRGEDDLAVFEEKLSALGASSDQLVGSCRATLSDSLHNPVNVEMMFVKTSTHDDKDRRYLLGIREFGDVAPVMPAPGSQPPKLRAAMAHKGTPPTLDRESFEERAPGSRAAAQTAKLRFPEMVPTLPQAMSQEIIVAMIKWNIEVPRTTCCSFHAYVAQMKQRLQDCSKMKCNHSFPAMWRQRLQCQQCGLFDPVELDDGDLECGFCESRNFKPLTSTTSL